MNTQRNKVGAILQARMSSQRLPGKVLRSIENRPLLDYVIDIVRRGDVDELVVATSTDASDDPIAEHCETLDVQCVRGPLDDVASRFCAVLLACDWDAFVRVSADSPLLDYRLVKWSVEAIRREGCDLATNIHPRTFPRGQSIEAVRRDVFLKSLAQMTQPGDQEHVTPVLYRHADQLGVINLRASEDFTGRHLAIDTPEDFEQVARTLAELNAAPWDHTLAEIVSAYDRAAATAPQRREAA